MKFVIQRVASASVKVNNETIGSIGKGYMVLIGVADSDTKEIADKNEMYEYIISKCKTFPGLKVEKGSFGADMKVELINDGPFTIVLDSEEM